MRARLFGVFDDSDSSFIEPREFRTGVSLLMQDDREKKLDMAFKIFDVDQNGFINEDELRSFLNQYFYVAGESAETVLRTFDTLFGAERAIARHIQEAYEKLRTYYIDAVVANMFRTTKDSAPGPGGQKRLYITEFKQWCFANRDRFKDWLDSLANHWIDRIKKLDKGDSKPTVAIGAESESVKLLQRSLTTPMSSAEAKAKQIKQPGYFSGAPKIPPPNCTFPRAKVKFIQDLFTKLGGSDAVMGPPEWKRCLKAAGVYNEDVSGRLFDLFDTSGDKEMNAKEFTWGLSDICSEVPPPGTTMTKEQVRRAFAYRFYDTNLQGFFEKDECRTFMLSWKNACIKCVRSANDRFMQVYGMAQEDLEVVPLPQVEKEQQRLNAVGEAINTQVTRFTDDIFRFFTGSQTTNRMNYEQFSAFAHKAPIIVEWLSTLGTYLEQRLPALKGMTFEDLEKKRPSDATHLSQHKMKTAFEACADKGVMNEDRFQSLFEKKMGSKNHQFAKLLFRVVDVNKNGSLTVDEFIDSFTTIIEGTPEQQLKIAFQLHDVQGKGYLDRKSLRMFFVSFFGSSLDEVNILSNSLDEWVNGRIKDTERGTKHAEREKGLPAHYFVGSARTNNLEIPVNLRKQAAGEVSMLVDQMVEHAMRYAAQSKLHLYAHEFNQWMPATTFVRWLINLGSDWMVTAEQMQQEKARAAADAVGLASTGQRSGQLPSMGPGSGPSEHNPLSAVVKATDVGKTVGSVIKTASSGEQPYIGLQPKSALTTGPGGTWWARAFSNRSHVERTQVRPRTHFDHITLGDVDAVFSREVAQRRKYSKNSFRTVMREGLRFDNPLVMNKMYTMFDVNGDGELDAEEVATGLVLMVRGSRSDRLKLAFSFFDAGGDGAMMKHEMRVFLRAFSRVSMEVMNGLIVSMTEVFGPVPVTGTEVMEAQEFKSKILKAARKKLETSADKMVQQAFAQDINADNNLSWAEFELWAEYNPQFGMWLQRLGIACLETLAPLEDRNQAFTGQRPVSSTYRVKRKFPLGTQFDQLRVHQVRSIFMSYSTYGKLGPQQFASCMNELHVHSPYTVRRLFTLFDRDVSGDVMMREFATGFFLLCGGTIHEKLAEAFNLFDLDGNGFLHPVELDMLLDSFYASVYPPTLPLRPFPPISMAFQACSLALRHVPVCLVVQSRWTWCARPSLSPPTSSSPMRASITR
jgi:Ca2+-binding EF-hand superfamily protein